MRWGARTVNILRPTTANAAPNVSGVVRSGRPGTRRMRYHFFAGSPFPLTYDGLNPFVHTTYRPDGTRLKWRRRRLMLAHKRKLASLYMARVPLTIMSIPPDETLLTFTRTIHLPSRRAKERALALGWAAARNQSRAGASIIGLPASSFGSDSCRILSDIQRMLLEPTIDGGVTWSLWTQEEVFQYMVDRINRFLLETEIIRKREVQGLAAAQQFATIPSDSLVIKRVVLNTSSE